MSNDLFAAFETRAKSTAKDLSNVTLQTRAYNANLARTGSYRGLSSHVVE